MWTPRRCRSASPPSGARAFRWPKSCEPRVYRPVLEYGGWGVRYTPFGRGWAYNVSGNRGVQLVMSSGRRALVGSQRPDDLAGAINAARRHQRFPTTGPASPTTAATE